MAKLLMPPDLLKSLVCSICEGYLSVFPIHIKTDGAAPICGRCKVPNDDDYIRDEAYEGLAQFLVFLCSEEKNGCTEQLTPLSLKEHEQCCVARKLDCPSKNFSRCNWRGPNKDLKAHFEESHKNLLLSDRRFEVNFTTSAKECLLLPYENELFLVKKEIDSRTGTCICSCTQIILKEKPDSFNYFVRIETSDFTYHHKFPERSTSPSWEERTKFTVDDVKEMLHDPAAVVAVIELVRTAAREEEDPVKTDIRVSEVDWEAISILACPSVCKEYVLPPIYQCVSGHSICSQCKPQLQQCPLCNAEIGNARNFVLEKMVERMIYPCKFHKSGCSVALISGEIRRHEASCEYGPYDCPVSELENCKSKFTKSEIIAHVENNHDSFILKSDKVNVPFSEENSDPVEKYYLIKFSNRLFKVCFKYSNDKFYWALQLIGPAEECKRFKFEIDIIDNSGKNLRQYARGVCLPLSKDKDCFTKKGEYIMFVWDQIGDFIVDNLSYRVRVLKE